MTMRKAGQIPHSKHKSVYLFNKVSSIRHNHYIYDKKHLGRVYTKQLVDFGNKLTLQEYINKQVILEDTKRVRKTKDELLSIRDKIIEQQEKGDFLVDQMKTDYRIGIK